MNLLPVISSLLLLIHAVLGWGSVPTDVRVEGEVGDTTPAPVNASSIAPILVPADLRSMLHVEGASDVEEMAAVAWCESRWQATAVNPSSGARGAWQFMERTWDYTAGVLGLDPWPAGALDLEQSTRAAVWLWESDGPQHWEGCR